MSWFDTVRKTFAGALEGGAVALLKARGSYPEPEPNPDPGDPGADVDDALNKSPGGDEGADAFDDALSKARGRPGRQAGGKAPAARSPRRTPQQPESGLSEAPEKGGGASGGGEGLIGIFTDPDLNLHGQGGIGGEYAERPTGMSWDVLRRMGGTPPIAAVGNTMCAGLAEFCTPQPNRHLPGMQVRIRGKEARYTPTKAEVRETQNMLRFLEHCGHYDKPSELVNRWTLEQTVRAMFWDSFRFDQACMQIEPKVGWERGGRFEPHRFYAWPAHTMRLAMPPQDGSRLADDDITTTRYVQVDRHNNVVAEFTGEQMLFGVLNPLTDIENAGYGHSTLEQLVDVLSGWLYGYGYNKAYFKQGANVRGILHFNEEPPKSQQRRFERYFHALVMGVGNAHKVPIAWGGQANWLALGQTNKDMEFNAWMDFLTKILCAIVGMDPSEINFTYGNTGQTGSIGGQADASEKIETSRNRWLRPRVRALFTWLNKWIVWQINPELEVVPTGIDIRSEEAENERLMKLATTTHTVDEVRAMMGDGPVKPADLKKNPGAIIMNPTWQQAIAAANAPEEGGGTPGMGEEEGVDGEGEEGDGQGEGDGEGQGEGQDTPSATPSEAPRQGQGAEDVKAALFGGKKRDGAGGSDLFDGKMIKSAQPGDRVRASVTLDEGEES